MENTENKFNYNDVWYIAVEEESCRGCAFERRGECKAPNMAQPCGSKRKDNRSVIFVESSADNFGDEE